VALGDHRLGVSERILGGELPDGLLQQGRAQLPGRECCGALGQALLDAILKRPVVLENTLARVMLGRGLEA
jgi:hypothetical protein